MGSRLLPSFSLRLLLSAFEYRFARRLRLVLQAETSAKGIELDRTLLESCLQLAELALALLHSRQQSVQPALAGRHARLGLGENCGIDSQPTGDGKAVGSARHSLKQPVRWGERGRIELERCVHHPRRLRRQLLEGAEVGGGQRERPTARQREQRGRRECPSLHRIGPTSDLVQQHQAALICLFQNESKRADMGAEGRKTGGDRLAIADIGVEPAKDRQTAPRPDRRYDSAGSKTHRESHRLEKDSFATGVRATDEKRVLVVRQLELE